MRVLSTNITFTVHTGEWTGSEGKTGIDKQPVLGPIRFANNEVESDVVVDKAHHGGYDQAVYAYAREDADWWEQEFAITIDNGRFGENLTTSGIDVNQGLVGERWKIGTVILELSQPRIPCRVFAGFWQRPTLIKEFMAAGRPGTYLRIIQEGEVSSGDEIEVISKPDHGITIADLYAAKNGERLKIHAITQVPQLSDSYRDWARSIAQA